MLGTSGETSGTIGLCLGHVGDTSGHGTLLGTSGDTGGLWDPFGDIGDTEDCGGSSSSPRGPSPAQPRCRIQPPSPPRLPGPAYPPPRPHRVPTAATATHGDTRGHRGHLPPGGVPRAARTLVTVVAVLGELGATAGDVTLAGPPGSLRAGLLALIAKIIQAMGHGHRGATHLRRALATAGATKATTGTATGTTPEPAAVPPGDSSVPRATAGDAWATVATIATRKWQEVVASVEATWTVVAGDAARLRDACRTVATAGDRRRDHRGPPGSGSGPGRRGVPGAAGSHPGAAGDLGVGHSGLGGGSPPDTGGRGQRGAAGDHQGHREDGDGHGGVGGGKTAMATVESAEARERERRAAAALEPLGHLVTACHGATRFYGHLRCLLKDIEATVAAMAAGHGGPEWGHSGPEAREVAQEGPGVPRATATTRGDPGVPKDLMAAVAAAEALWDANARLAQGHLLGTLRMARGLLLTCGVTDATAAATVAQRCRDATSALPGLLPRGSQ
ncbi:uncharacterized protein M6G45_016277 [Spheniscus humboldti]